MMKKPGTSKDVADKLVEKILRKTRQTYSAEERSALFWPVCVARKASRSCVGEGIAESLYYSWSKEFPDCRGKCHRFERTETGQAAVVGRNCASGDLA